MERPFNNNNKQELLNYFNEPSHSFILNQMMSLLNNNDTFFEFTYKHLTVRYVPIPQVTIKDLTVVFNRLTILYDILEINKPIIFWLVLCDSQQIDDLFIYKRTSKRNLRCKL